VGQSCQQLGKLIARVNVGATRMEWTQHYRGKRLESSTRIDRNKKISNGRQGKEKKLVDRKGSHAGNEGGLHSGKEQAMFKKDVK
jgi:hypothetical protein